MNILFDTTPLGNAHAHRGIGIYTQSLIAELELIPSVTVVKKTQEQKELPPLDIVHYPYFDFFFSTLPILHPAKAVVTIHDVIPLRFPDYYQPGVKGKLRFLKQTAALKNVSAVITDSAASKADIIEFLRVREENIHVVYLAGNPQIQQQNEYQIRKVRKTYSIPSQYILYVGDINYNKNIPQLIKTLKYLPDRINLVCVGRNFHQQDIPEWQWIETQIAMSNVADRVLFIHDILGDATETLSALYSGAIAYIQPSLFEGFGLPVLEAMQCKTPVVSSNNSSLSEIGGEHVMFAEEPKAESFAETIEQVLRWKAADRTRFVEAAYTWSKKFSWKKTAHQTYEVYQKVLQ